MTFIGIITDNKSFEIIKENFQAQDIKLIHINNQSINNIKNITFKIIIINKELKILNENIDIIEKLCLKSKYLIINTDIDLKLKFAVKNKVNVITFGLNHKATVTVSSITENNILIYLQRNIKNMNNSIVEVGEKQVKINKENRLNIYEYLMIYILYIIKN